jgi:hypothetical protein
MTRDEHLEYCKTRALEYVDGGDVRSGFSSMVSDLNKHDETKDHAGIYLGFDLLRSGHLESPDNMRKFIKDFK